MSEIEFDKRELQLKLCDILYAVAKICEEHDIRYYLDGYLLCFFCLAK